MEYRLKTSFSHTLIFKVATLTHRTSHLSLRLKVVIYDANRSYVLLFQILCLWLYDISQPRVFPYWTATTWLILPKRRHHVHLLLLQQNQNLSITICTGSETNGWNIELCTNRGCEVCGNLLEDYWKTSSSLYRFCVFKQLSRFILFLSSNTICSKLLYWLWSF